MPFSPIPQTASPSVGPWLADLALATSGLTLSVSGAAVLDGTSHPASQSFALMPPATGSQTHVLCVDAQGVLHMDLDPDTPRAANIAWFDLPAGTTDLGAVTIHYVAHSAPPG